MGFVLLVLITPIGGYDVLADPIGWLLVLHGLRGLPDLPLGTAVRCLAVLAAIVSVPLWVPAVVEALEAADESIAWAVNLPQFGFVAVLSLALSRAALQAGARGPAAWWRTTFLGAVAVIVLPVLVFGGGVDSLEDTAGIAVVAVPLAMIVLLFTYTGRSWTDARNVEKEAKQPGRS